jgi:hypothetical protein
LVFLSQQMKDVWDSMKYAAIGRGRSRLVIDHDREKAGIVKQMQAAMRYMTGAGS